MIYISARKNWDGLLDYGLTMMPGRLTICLIFINIQIDFGERPPNYNKVCNFLAGYDKRENKAYIMLGRNIWYMPLSVR